jgi:hypothetical protein
MSRADSHADVGRYSLVWMALATLAMLPTQAAETQERKPLTKPGQTYVGIDVTGCAEQCPSYEIYLFDNGRMKFRGNQFTSDRGTVNHTPFGEQYKKLVEYISSGNLAGERPACADEAGHTSVTLFSTVGGESKKATYSFGCAGDVETATSLISRFVDGSGNWKRIYSEWKYWTEKKFDSKPKRAP